MSHVTVAEKEARWKKQGWRGGDVRTIGTATSAAAEDRTHRKKLPAAPQWHRRPGRGALVEAMQGAEVI